MAQYVALLQLHYRSMKQMQVAPAHGAARHLQNDVPRLDNLGFGCLDNLDLVLAHPGERLHLLAGRIGVLVAVEGRVRNVLLGDGIVVVA